MWIKVNTHKSKQGSSDWSQLLKCDWSQLLKWKEGNDRCRSCYFFFQWNPGENKFAWKMNRARKWSKQIWSTETWRGLPPIWILAQARHEATRRTKFPSHTANQTSPHKSKVCLGPLVMLLCTASPPSSAALPVLRAWPMARQPELAKVRAMFSRR